MRSDIDSIHPRMKYMVVRIRHHGYDIVMHVQLSILELQKHRCSTLSDNPTKIVGIVCELLLRDGARREFLLFFLSELWGCARTVLLRFCRY